MAKTWISFATFIAGFVLLTLSLSLYFQSTYSGVPKNTVAGALGLVLGIIVLAYGMQMMNKGR